MIAGLTVTVSMFLSTFLFYSISFPILFILLLLLISKINKLTNKVNPYLLSSVGALFGLSAIFIDILSLPAGTLAVFFILCSIIKVLFINEKNTTQKTNLIPQNGRVSIEAGVSTQSRNKPAGQPQHELLKDIARKVDISLADIQLRLQRIEKDGLSKPHKVEDVIIERLRASIKNDMMNFYKMNQDQMNRNLNIVTAAFENEIKMVEKSIDILVNNTIANNRTQKDIQLSIEQMKQKSNELATIDAIRELLIDNIKEIDHPIDMLHIQNGEIKDYFYRALDEAKHEVCIISPWISNWVVTDSDIQARFEELLTNGVNIKVLFGINGDSLSLNGDKRGEKTDKVVKVLKSKYSKKRYTGKLQFGKVNSHYKLFICDNEFFVESSMNILSYKGDYGKGFEWHEGGTYSEHQKTLSTLKNIYFGPNTSYTIV